MIATISVNLPTMSGSPPFRLAALGCQHPHFPDYCRAIRETETFRLSHVFDEDQPRLSRILAQTGASIFDPAAPPPEVDAFLLLRETRQRLDDIARLARLGRPIFVEKPLAAGPSITHVARHLEPLGPAFHTGFFLRSLAALANVRDLLTADALGRVAQARVRFAHDGLRANWIEADAWLLEPASAVYGGFGDLAIHVVDLLNWWELGELSPLALRTSAVLQRTAVEDQGVALLRMGAGGTAIVEAGWASGSGAMLQIELLGSEGTIASREGRLVAELSGGRHDDLGALDADAAAGLRPFLHGVASGDWSGCVSLPDATSAALLLEAIYARAVPD